MTDHATDAHSADDDAVAHHDAVTRMDTHTAISDDHGHAEPRLGPVDWRAWGYAGGGVLAGLAVAAFFYLKAG